MNDQKPAQLDVEALFGMKEIFNELCKEPAYIGPVVLSPSEMEKFLQSTDEDLVALKNALGITPESFDKTKNTSAANVFVVKDSND